MSAVQEIKEAVLQLSPDDLAAFRAWFAEFDGSLWDQQFEEDVAAGRLDRLAEEIPEHVQSYGSVEGTLEVLSKRGALSFSLKDASTEKSIRCYFGEELASQAHAAWGKRVAVFGVLNNDEQGNVHTVQVWDIAVLHSPEELPGPEEMMGLVPDMTGGMPSEKYAKERYGQ